MFTRRSFFLGPTPQWVSFRAQCWRSVNELARRDYNFGEPPRQIKNHCSHCSHVTGFFEFHEPPQLELLFALDPKWFGKGYAAEIAAAVIRARTPGEQVLASTDEPNLASIKLLKRLGFEERRRYRESDALRDTIEYRLLR